MRAECFDCVLKHIAQAEVLSTEVQLGYDLHQYLVIGHLAEAEAECLLQSETLAHDIRSVRLAYTETRVFDGLQLIERITDNWAEYTSKGRAE